MDRSDPPGTVRRRLQHVRGNRRCRRARAAGHRRARALRASVHGGLELHDGALPSQARRERAPRARRASGAAVDHPATRQPDSQRRLSGDRQAGRRGRFDRRRAAVGGSQRPRAQGARSSDARELGRGDRPALRRGSRAERRHRGRYGAADRRDRFQHDAQGALADRDVSVKVGDWERRRSRFGAPLPGGAARAERQ